MFPIRGSPKPRLTIEVKQDRIVVRTASRRIQEGLRELGFRKAGPDTYVWDPSLDPEVQGLLDEVRRLEKMLVWTPPGVDKKEVEAKLQELRKKLLEMWDRKLKEMCEYLSRVES